MENHWVEKWLSLQENPRTRASYRRGMEKFTKFCKEKEFNGLETVVLEYRAARDSDDRRKLSQYTDAWNDVLQEYTIWLKHHHAQASSLEQRTLPVFVITLPNGQTRARNIFLKQWKVRLLPLRSN